MLKLTVIGGGSTYTPELVEGLLQQHAALPLDKLWLMDVDGERLAVVGGLARRMVEAAGTPFTVHLTTERAAALRGASFVVTQMRVGGMTARREDERLGRRHGLVGQETTGVGGMAKALRTIPLLLDISREMARLAPRAVLVNFANPAGLVTEALLRYGDAEAIGLCNIPWNARAEIARRLGVAEAAVELDVAGLNHLSWVRGVRVQGQDVGEALIAAYAALQEGEGDFDPALVRALHALPNPYLRYYYHTARVLAEQQASTQTRADEVMAIERELLALYADPGLAHKPAALEQRGGAGYSQAAAALLADLHNDAGSVQVVNTRNDGALPNLPADVVVELPCRIGRDGARPLPAAPLAPAMWGLVSAVKAYELLTVEAAVRGDRDAARLALLNHPLGPDGDNFEAVLQDMLATNRAWLSKMAHG